MKNFPWLNKPFLEPMKNLLRIFILSLFATVALPSFAIMKYATITNDLPVDALVQVSQGGAVFGGQAVVPNESISAGGTVNKSLDVTNDNNLKVFASVSAFTTGGGQFNGYYCLKTSGISIADARNQACGPSVYRPATVSTNGSGYLCCLCSYQSRFCARVSLYYCLLGGWQLLLCHDWSYAKRILCHYQQCLGWCCRICYPELQHHLHGSAWCNLCG